MLADTYIKKDIVFKYNQRKMINFIFYASINISNAEHMFSRQLASFSLPSWCDNKR